MKSLAYAVFALLLTCEAARAATPFDLYEQGQYDAAIAAGVAQNSAQGFAIAARAELAAETMREAPCLICIRRAEVYARKAITADPKSADGHVFLAVALGRDGRLVGALTVISQSYASHAKYSLDAALAADPTNVFAWAALGGWNIEIVHKAGPAIARIVYGASQTAGMTDFEKAFALAPGNITVRYQYALTLSAFDTPYFRKDIENALMRVENGTPHGAYEIFIQARAVELLKALNKNDMPYFAALVSRDQGNPR